MSTEQLLPADTTAADASSAADPVATLDSSPPSLSALDAFIHQPFRPDAPAPTEQPTGEPQPPAQTAQPTQEEIDILDLINADPDGAKYLAKYGGDPVQFVRGGLEAMKLASRRDEEAIRWRETQQFLAAQQQVGQQQQVAQQQPAAEPKVWDAPEFKPEWRAMLGRDPETGKVTGPPEIVAKWEAFQTWAAQRNLELLADPLKTLGPVIDARAAQIAEQKQRETLAQYDTQLQARQFVEANRSWMVDPNNPNQLTPLGQVFGQTVSYLAQQGVPQHIQIQMGQQAVNAAYYQWQAEQAAAQQQQRIAQQPPARPNAPAATHAPSSASPTPQNTMGLYKQGEDLESRVLQNLKAHGFGLDQFMNSST